MNAHNRILTAMTLTAALAVAPSAFAIGTSGFAPWEKAGVEHNIDARQDKVEIFRFGSFRQAGAADVGVHDERQAAVEVKSWYMDRAI